MRSRADEVMEEIHLAIGDAEVVVLNGDTFDFRWSTLPTIRHSVKAALDWLEELARRHDHCRIEVVLGNHDYHIDFMAGLSPLSSRVPNLSWHEYHLQLGEALFLHGDCADYRMSAEQLAENRASWYNDRKQKPRWMGRAYTVVDRVGISAAIPRVLSPPAKAVGRIIHYLDNAAPGLMNDVGHVYFGHTHLPFIDYAYGGKYFHNTGAAVGHTNTFNMLNFKLNAA